VWSQFAAGAQGFQDNDALEEARNVVDTRGDEDDEHGDLGTT